MSAPARATFPATDRKRSIWGVTRRGVAPIPRRLSELLSSPAVKLPKRIAIHYWPLEEHAEHGKSAASASVGANVAIWLASVTLSPTLTLCIA
jgi:hypothetical protein